MDQLLKREVENQKVSNVKLEWITPDAEKRIMYMARVSNPKNQDSDNVGLIGYLIKHRHWSPFEMANACFEINTTRDIARQILRHRSFSYQEFSQRYADPTLMEHAIRETRLQDFSNRQNSLSNNNSELDQWWKTAQASLWQHSLQTYNNALNEGIAKEVARSVLPEGMTRSRMYMNGTIRSWIHYIQLRTDPSTQKEHRCIAEEIDSILNIKLPNIWKALNNA